jgi:hypothetical protein
MQEPYEAALETALSSLEQAHQLLGAQIKDYPTPISGCDAQFNQLLSDRKRISKALQALQDAPFIPTPRVLEQGALSESR